MFTRTFTDEEIAKKILNKDNPKTMDYFFMRLLKVQMNDTNIDHNGVMRGAIRSTNPRITEAFGMLRRLNGLSRGQIHFVLDMHENQIFPKSRSFRICGRRLLPTLIVNPDAGKKKQITYGSGYVSTYTEPNEIMTSKHLLLYCRNSWTRKGDIKPSRVKNNETKEEVVATDVPVSVI
jgi:hypothetical protein